MTSRIAIVTGAGSGIGRAAALALIQNGWTVVFAGRREDRLQESVSLASDRSRCLIVPTDVADPESVESLFEQTKRAFQRLDLLFNNAGQGAPPATPDELSIEQWRTVIDVNVTGSFLCARAAFRMMRAQSPQGGRIINNGSISATAPRPGSIAYTASKHAVTGLTKTLALDGRQFGIACGQIDIGNADTELAARMRVGVPQADGRVVAEPIMSVDAVAQAVVYMAGLPLDANVLFMTVMATNMPFVGRG